MGSQPLAITKGTGITMTLGLIVGILVGATSFAFTFGGKLATYEVQSTQARNDIERARESDEKQTQAIQTLSENVAALTARLDALGMVESSSGSLSVATPAALPRIQVVTSRDTRTIQPAASPQTEQIQQEEPEPQSPPPAPQQPPGVIEQALQPITNLLETIL